MRGRGGFGGRPLLRPRRPLIRGRRPLFWGPGCLGFLFPLLIVGVFALMMVLRVL